LPIFFLKNQSAIALTVLLILFSPFWSASAGVLENAIHMDPITNGDLRNVIWGYNPARALGPSHTAIPTRHRHKRHKRHKRRKRHRSAHRHRATSHPRARFHSTELHFTDCQQDNRFARIDSLIADAAKIQQAVGCAPVEYVQLEKARQDYTQAFAGEFSLGRQTRTIQGRAVQGTPDELNAAEAILRIHPPQSWFLNSTPECTSVRCALTQAFKSEEAALRALMIHKKYGYAISLSQKYTDKNSANENLWTATQVRGIEEFLSRLPSAVLERARLKEITLFSAEMSEAVARDAHLQVHPSGVYNAYDREHPQILISTRGHATNEGIHHVFAHEFGHAFDFASAPRFSQASGFESLSQWQDFRQSNGTYFQNSHTDFIEKYSQASPLEDFADAFNYFVNHPEVLKSVEPKKYAFLRSQVFEGKEYTPVGVIPSLELEGQINLRGGYPAILRECVSKLEMRLGSKGELWVAEGGPDGANLRAEAFVEQGANACFQAAAQELAKSLSENTDVCHMGGAEGIEAHLKAKLNYPLQKFLRGVAPKAAKMTCKDLQELEQLGLELGSQVSQHCR